MKKVCPRCKRELPLEAYSLGNGKYGRRSICKDCDHQLHTTDEYRERKRVKRNQRRHEDPEYVEREKQSQINKLLNDNSSYKKYMVRNARERAKKLRVPFALNYQDFEIPEYCPLLGIKLIKHVGHQTKNDDSPSLDRIVPNLGYTKDNVWVISMKANRIKNDSSLEELEMIVNNLKKHLLLV